MHISAIIVIVLLLLSIFVFRKFSSFVYSIAIIDIFLRIIYYIAIHLPLGEFNGYVKTYFPESIPAMVRGLITDTLICNIIIWIYIAFMGIFWFYSISYFMKKKK